MSEYADRTPWELEPHYIKHVSAMTAEGLHSKAAIAAELAHRDMAIERLTAEVEQLRNRPCPYTITSEEGSSYCSLAHTTGEEIANLKEQLAAREADVAAILKWYESYTSISECFGLMKALKKSGNHHLREHEAQLLEEMASKIPDTTYFQEIFALLMNEAAARRTK